ncbi:MAG: glycosyltransferase family 2 protein [Solirubrobacteraceae bacterium]
MSAKPDVTPVATVAIVTRNRRDELRGALRSADAQTVDCELVVVDDGSEDGTAEMVAAEFPSVRLHRSERREGTLIQRNRAVRMAGAAIVFFLDDDAAFSSERVVDQTLPEFEQDDVGAVSIPNLDLVGERLEWIVRPAAPDKPAAVRAFVGCSHALRRSAFLQVGGYRESMSNYGEESELCLRLLDSGFFVTLGSSDPVHHFRSRIGRSKPFECRARTRNTILSALLLAPASALPGYLLLVLAYVPFDIARDRNPLAFAAGIFEGFRDGWRQRGQRRPVSTVAFRLAERLRRHEPLPLETVRATLHGSERRQSPSS